MKSSNLKNFLITLFSILVFLHILFSIYKIVTTKAPDFEVLWLGAKDLLAGNNPYLNKQAFTGIGYPLTTLVFYIPFALLDYKLAQTAFVLLSFLAIYFSVFLSIKIIGSKIRWQNLFLLSSLVLLSFPAKFTLGMGQNNSITLLFLLLFFYFYKKGKENLSAIFLGLSFSLKTIFLFFIIFPILKRKWRLLLVSLIVLLIFFIISNFWANLDYYFVYFRRVILPLLTLRGREIYYNQGISGFITRSFENPVWRKSFIIFLSAGFLANSIHLTFKNKKHVLSFSLLIITLLLIDSLSWQHHFVWLIFPFIVLMSEFIKKKNMKFKLLLILAFILVGWNFKSPGLYVNFPYLLLLSNTFYGTLILYFLNTYTLYTRKGKQRKS